MNCTVTLQNASISHVPFDNYQKDFTFIINNQEFSINKIIADILSLKISKIHLIDPTLDQYIITTKNKGSFQTILNLITSNCIEITENQIPFISEIIQILEITAKITINNGPEITIDNALDLLHLYEQNPHFYEKLFEKTIDYISENFYTIETNQKGKFLILSNETIELILGNSKLKLENENQLLNFVNFLYSKNSTYSNLYDFVLFTNVDVSSIDQFISVFNVDHITHSTWIEISKRLKHEIQFEKDEMKLNESNRYSKPITKNVSNKKQVTANLPFNNGQFNGIFKYLQTNSDIKNEVEITSSSKGCFDPFNLLQFDNIDNYFYPSRMNTFNQWICFEIKNHRVIPTDYTIRSEKSNSTGGFHPKSWVIEGSNDKNQWDKLDEQTNCSYLNGSSLVHTFNMNVRNKKEYKFIRMRLTGPNWCNDEILLINSIEFYGEII